MKASSFVLARAKRLFRSFTGRGAKRGDIGVLTINDTLVMVIGKCDGILYTTVRDGKEESYIHEFGRRDGQKGANPRRPVLAISSDGKQAFILAGGYKFTERGFVG